MLKSKIAWLAYGNISIKIFGFLIFAIVSKTLPQSEYAKYAYYIFIIGIALELVNSGLIQGVQNEVSKNISNEKYLKLLIDSSVSLGFLFSIASAIFVIGYLSVDKIDGKIDGISPKLYIGLFIYIIFSTAYSVMNIIYIGIKESKQYFYSIITQGIIALVLVILLLVNEYKSPDNILICIGVSYVAGTLLQMKWIRPSFSISSKAISKLFSKGKWYALWSFASIIESRVELYLLSVLSTPKSFAIFDVSTKYLLIGQVLTLTLAQKFLPEILGSRSASDIKEQLSVLDKTTYKLILFNFILSIPVAVFIFIFYSGEYNESIYCFVILTLAMTFNIRNMNNTTKIISNEKEYLLFVVMIIVILIKIPVSWLLIVNLKEIGASISVLLAQALSFVMFAVTAKKMNNNKL
jgi:O-antigen/teichoic acid export membrane protein